MWFSKSIRPEDTGAEIGHSVHQVCTSIPEVTRKVDERNAIDVVFINFSKAFDKVTHGRLVRKVLTLDIYGEVIVMDHRLTFWTEDCHHKGWNSAGNSVRLVVQLSQAVQTEKERNIQNDSWSPSWRDIWISRDQPGYNRHKRVSNLLHLDDLGDRTPSALMDEMLTLEEGHKPCLIFEQAFLIFGCYCPTWISAMHARSRHGQTSFTAPNVSLQPQSTMLKGCCPSQHPWPVQHVSRNLPAHKLKSLTQNGASTINGGEQEHAGTASRTHFWGTTEPVTVSGQSGWPSQQSIHIWDRISGHIDTSAEQQAHCQPRMLSV
ncbi:uncharacterized protein [Narcine bancroftii]|uniref:uncharacterized protein n=1 Tax=Narcine bancroftii TaxID=1343680 RepID=UPI0038316358